MYIGNEKSREEILTEVRTFRSASTQQAKYLLSTTTTTTTSTYIMQLCSDYVVVQ